MPESGVYIYISGDVFSVVNVYSGSFCFRRELGFLNCDDIGMRVVNKQFVSFSNFYGWVCVLLWFL